MNKFNNINVIFCAFSVVTPHHTPRSAPLTFHPIYMNMITINTHKTP